MTRKQLVTQVLIIANHVARRAPDYAKTLREAATVLAHEDQLVEKAMAFSDHIVFDQSGKATIKDDEAFAEYFFAFTAVFADRRNDSSG